MGVGGGVGNATLQVLTEMLPQIQGSSCVLHATAETPEAAGQFKAGSVRRPLVTQKAATGEWSSGATNAGVSMS